MLALLLCVACPSPAAPPETKPSATNLPELKAFASKHYTIYTNLSRAETLPYGTHMDAVFEEYDRRFTSFRPQTAQLMSLFIFRTQKQYQAYLQHHDLDANNTSGMFFIQPDLQGLATFINGRPRSTVFQTLQHEGFHQFAHIYFGGHLPTWLNEGLAQYFEDGILVDSAMTIGLVNPTRLVSVQQALAKGTAFDFNKLLALSNDAWNHTLRTNAKKATMLYDQAWLATYFLIHAENGKYRPAFEQMLLLISQGTPANEAFAQAFGNMDTTSFRQRWENYARALKPDPLATAAVRLEMLCQALAFLHDKNLRMPASADELRRTLLRIGYRGERTRNNVTTHLSGSDNTAFVYPRSNGEPVAFDFLPAVPGFPPALRATELKPTPVLIWSRDAAGKAAFDVEYK